MDIFILNDSEQEGPYSEPQLRAALELGELHPDTPARRDSQTTWRSIKALLQEEAPAIPPVVTEVVPDRASYAAIFADALSYPIHRSAWLTIVVGAVCFSLVRLFASISTFVPRISLAVEVAMISYLMAFFFDIISMAAGGSDGPPEWPTLSDFADDVIQPFLKAIFALVVALAPAITLTVYVAIHGSHHSFHRLEFACWLGVAVAWAVLYFPIAILGMVAFGNFGGALPHVVIPALIRTFPASLLPGFLNILLLGLLFYMPGFGHYGVIYALISHLYQSATILYCLMAQGRFLGLFYLREQAALPWG